jgi:hypothetical protein
VRTLFSILSIYMGARKILFSLLDANNGPFSDTGCMLISWVSLSIGLKPAFLIFFGTLVSRLCCWYHWKSSWSTQV